MKEEESKNVFSSSPNDLDEAKWRKTAKSFGLVMLILVIWGLLVIPIVFYYLSLPQVSAIESSNILNGCSVNFFY